MVGKAAELTAKGKNGQAKAEGQRRRGGVRRAGGGGAGRAGAEAEMWGEARVRQVARTHLRWCLRCG